MDMVPGPAGTEMKTASPAVGEIDVPRPSLSPTGGWAILFLAWLTASAATLGSLFFSHVMGFAPCVLCWYQRIFLFPLVPVLAAGLFPFDRRVTRFSLPLVIAGWLTALYHNLLHAEVVPAAMQPCSRGVSCTEEYIELEWDEGGSY